MQTTSNAEHTLIQAAQNGDLEAFNALILKYQDMLYRIALRILHDEADASDALQNALIQAFCNLCAFRGGSLKSWLARVTINASYDELRRTKRHVAIPLEQYTQDGDEIESPYWMVDPAAGPEDVSESKELQNAIQRCLRSLTPEYRLVLILVDIEGMSYEEAARAARIPVGTVKSRLARARMQLRRSLRGFPHLLPEVYRRVEFSPLVSV
ncbi:MAG TPA: sigma-70 family RNA polymerase sigma factor [Anaerolineales bacterium]|nr:sigma-70 family RNA polymerase sigma factor [Anaerolineales bacterium]